ncbi:hypothetical protein [Flavobacterium nitrogenifigens]|uniref:20S proteasome, alpha and beta subunits n=1 Tax=Flavobacterium nitrogenifigens TaxID=1617283 RepID=A0A521AZX3_9FLAO|nr:hypothetical protein [Flavobacterium nitrogenifigens]KAF2329128.1 hypothetical protein DM397_15740 [Flavobacterium nitrogenifigens]SMO40398.1 20S proteasome, alpha and beta subunits [Flavobacterium nitrogenifigens]
MSVIIAVYTPTGIVISGDSRTTGAFNQTVPNPQNPQQQINIQTMITLSDATLKVFKIFDKYGIGTFGDAQIDDLPIAHYIEQFEINNLANPPRTTNDLVTDLLNYFRQFNPIPKTGFVVAGYDNNDPFVFGVDIFNNVGQRHNYIQPQNQINYGIVRGGDTDVINRLLNNPQRLPIFQTMNLQDGVDFSRHLIRTTIDQMRFEPAVPTVGGEIDTLIITNNKTEFLNKKKLSCK